MRSSAKVTVADMHSSGNPNGSLAGYATGWAAPAATKNVAGIVIDATTGEIIITTTAAAGAGTLSLNPNVAGAILPVGTAAFTPAQGAVEWRCAAAGSAGNVGQTLPQTLLSKYAPSECR